ncbi:MAG: hypothetical protein KKA84_12160 [Bacteroidetes bacterium]|nr:hypothetical protein [Bacteroidota bacterium]
MSEEQKQIALDKVKAIDNGMEKMLADYNFSKGYQAALQDMASGKLFEKEPKEKK